MTRTLLLLFILYPIYTAGQFVSPCPNLFSYDNIGADSWSGSLRVPINVELAGIWLKAVFDRPFDELSSDFGESVHREPNEYLIRRPNNKVEAGTTLPIRITARNNPVLGAPQLLGYRLNGETICPENGVIPPPPPVESLSAGGGGGGLQSPCPALFSYEPLGVEGNRWYGNINVRSDADLAGVWMRVVLDRLPVEFGTDNFGTAEQKNATEFLIKNRNHQVKAGDILRIRVHADFIPGETPPKLLGYRLNGRTVCPENGHIELPMPEIPLSPCPSMFQYEPRGPEKDRWHGNINVRSEAELSGVWMRVIFDKPVIDLVTDFGEVVRRGDGDFLVKSPTNKVPSGGTVTVRITPQFNPNEEAPKLIEIRLNARTLCPENGIVETTTLSIAQQLISPCPEMFTYEPPGTEPDRWYGNINLMTNTQLNGLWIRVILDRQSLQLGNWFGMVKTDDNTIYRIQNRDYKLAPGTVAPLRFFIKYNRAEPIPKLIEIKINGATVCPSSGNTASGGGFPTQNQVSPPTVDWQTTVAPRPSGGRPPRPDWGGAWRPPSVVESSSQFQCGEVATKPIPLLSGGAPTEEGEWPWHAALYYTGGGTPDYYCGGVLVSLNHVLTAAHCAAITGTRTPMSISDVQVYLGKYLLRQSNRGVQFMQVRRILIHPEYDNNIYANDIAMLHLSRPAEYTDWVRPVCLWSESIDLNSVHDREGTVVGWGYDSKGSVTDKLLKAGMPVVTKAKCIWSHKKFYKRFVNENSKNFCAGFRHGASVCTGDSGGGLVFPMLASNSRWQLRGLVSLSVALQSAESACDPTHYAVFTDVAQFLPWIEQNINSV